MSSMSKIKSSSSSFVNLRCLKKSKVLAIKKLSIVLLIELDNHNNLVDVNNLLKRRSVRIKEVHQNIQLKYMEFLCRKNPDNNIILK